MHRRDGGRQGPVEGNSDSPPNPLNACASAGVRGFPLGRIVATPNALAQISREEILRGLQRHQNQDWGTLNQFDRAANDQALQEGTRILSAYRDANGVTFWIITEADRSATKVLMPEDY